MKKCLKHVKYTCSKFTFEEEKNVTHSIRLFKLAPFVADHELEYMQTQVTAVDKALREGTGAGNDFTGWIDLPENYDKEEFARIKKQQQKFNLTLRY